MTINSAKLPVSEFSEFRALSFSIAYRMLGSVAEAEDIVQESFLRFHRAQAEGAVIESPKAYLAAVTTRLAIDHLRSARVRRESYVGTWLPEPVIDEKEPAMVRQVEMSESLSMAFLLILESLSPTERAVFLLREVFDYDYLEISQIVEKSEENCRQIFARARRHIEAGKPRFEVSPEKRNDLAGRFFAACQSGDLGDLMDLLVTDAAFYGDGGGKAAAVLRAVHGRERVARLLHGMFAKGKAAGIRLRLVDVNAQPGAMVFDSRERLISVLALDIVEGGIQSIRTVINPDKLAHLGPLSELTKLPPRNALDDRHRSS
jgi:RNA polymerase sigma-70 factor (ECF subfamily)